MKKIVLVSMTAILVLISVGSTPAFAHPGGLDSRGGHYVRTPGWGYPVGSYHYHRGSATGTRRSGSSLVARLVARINELTDLANSRLTQIRQLQNDVAFRDGIIADLRNRLAAAGAPMRTGLTVLSHTSQINTIGYYEVNGEVQNSTGSPIKFPKIVATLYDASGAVIGNEFTYATVSPLQPGQKSPFRLIVLDSGLSPRIARYELRTVY